ncbi:alpha/beta fold hydrolase [Bacillus daqingensis]|uniref:Alpha/beta fold hydrolase n=2 Tax=Bacillus daqingensis TaxID=872396 RepID=A0ABV9NVV8_9BACI
MMAVDIEFTFIDTNHVTLHTALAGPKDGELVVLLHGFPEFWYGWRHQIEALAEAGYRVAVPDQRGYNLSSKPDGASLYTVDLLRDDVAGLIEQLGYQEAYWVGHDWGGAVAWYAAATKPKLVKKLTAINIPYPGAMGKALLRYPPQLLKSLYMAFFQIPELPEKLMQTDDLEQMKKGIAMAANPGAFTEDDLDRYKTAWAQPGALTGMLNWYRAIWRKEIRPDLVQVPVRILWGLGDPFLHKTTAKVSLEYCAKGELIYIDDATHWVHHEQPDVINRLMLEFLQQEKT